MLVRLLKSLVAAMVVNVPSGLPEHLHHLGLEHRVHGLDADTGTTLRHSENIHYSNCIFVDKLSQHQAHDFHRHTSTTVS